MEDYCKSGNSYKRFWSKVNKTESCWEWIASVDDSGYGLFKVHNKLYKAHRYAYVAFNGMFSSELCVLHKCDNRKCVNPSHLFLGTREENNKDRDNKNRQITPKGELHGSSVLSNEQVIEIKRLLTLGKYTQRQISKLYKVSPTCINRIKLRKTWSYL